MLRPFLFLFLLLTLASSCREKEQADAPTPVREEKEAIPGLEKINAEIDKSPESASIYFQRAEIYLLNGVYDKGIKDLEMAIGLDSSEAKYYLRLADALVSISDPSLNLPDSRKAIETLERFLKRQPGTPEVEDQLLDLLIYTKQNEAALNLIAQMTAENAYRPLAYFKKGFILKSEGDTAAALQAFRKASEQNPQFYEAYLQMGLLSSHSDPDLALRYFDNALEIRPESKEALYAKARLLQDVGQYAEARKIYQKIVGIDAQDEQVFYNLAYLYFEEDSLEKAERNFSIAIGLNPAFDFAYYARGVVRESMGNTEGARLDYENALRINPEHEYAREALEELKKKN